MKHSDSRRSVLAEYHPTPLWWTVNLTGWIYFLRELTGIGIAFYAIVFILSWALNDLHNIVLQIATWIGLVSAFFHSFTWAAVTLKVTPFDLPRWAERLGLVGLIGGWTAVSYFLLQLFYVP